MNSSQTFDVGNSFGRTDMMSRGLGLGSDQHQHQRRREQRWGRGAAGGVRWGVWELTDALGFVIAQASGDTIAQVAWYDPWGVQDTIITAGWGADHG